MKKLLSFIAAFVLLATAAAAQCSSRNTAFQSGETLIYDLYFNWKFVWVKAGTASMNTTQTVWNGRPSFRTYLITRGSKRADRFFVMRDTLLAYTDLDLVPRYYRKGAFEGKTYRRNEVWYSYSGGQSHVKMRYQRDNDRPQYLSSSSRYCAFDMISMLMRARSFDATNYRPGHRIPFLMADGHTCTWQSLVFRGRETIKMRGSGTTYRCLVISFMEKENGKESEVVRFFVTDDKNHLPVRLDMYLNFGAAKAYLSGVKGLRNPMTAKVK